MSDIQEEQKRLYKRAEEYDKENRRLLKEIHNREINELQERINKAIEYIWSTKYEWGDLEEDNEDFDIDVYELLNILKGDNN